MTAVGAALVHLEVSEPVPIEAPAGSDVVVRLRASCPDERNRCGLSVRVTAPDGSEATHPLATHQGTVSDTADIVLHVPPRVGEHVWRFALPAHEIAGVRCDEATLDVAVHARPQTTSLAVWDIPSPVAIGARFAVRVGAKSAAGCVLTGQPVEICDDAGTVVAQCVLGDAPLPGTAALYWTDVELVAPANEGLASWSVRFAAAALDLPHDGASSTFSAEVVRPPEHKLTVKVVEKDTANAIDEAVVRLGAFRAETGRSGYAEIRVPKGRYELQVWKAGYDIKPATLELDGDVSIEVEALALPEEDPDARWTM